MAAIGENRRGGQVAGAAVTVPAPRAAAEPTTPRPEPGRSLALRCRIRRAEGHHGGVRLYEAAFTADVTGAVGGVAGCARVAVVPAWDIGAFEALDRISWDLSAAAHTLSRWGHTLDWLQGRGANGLAIVETVEVRPQWRGRRIGYLGTALMLDALRVGLSGAVLFPMAPGASGDSRSASHERLTAYWARLGFRPWMDGHLSLPLADGTLRQAAALLADD